MTEREFEEKLYREGLIENIPTRHSLDSRGAGRAQRLGQVRWWQADV